jgi:excisionase family DNA binding protein
MRAETDTIHVERLGYRPARAAEALDVTRQHVFNLIARGEIRAIKLGNATIIPAAEIARLLAGEQ